MAFVVADRWRRSDRPKPSTVSVSSSPSRTLAHSVVSVQAPRQVLQQTLGRLDVAVRVGAREDHLHPRPLCLREMLQELMDRHRCTSAARPNVGRSRAFRDDPVRSPRLPRLVKTTDRRVLRGPFPQAERVFRAHDAEGDNDTVSTPSMQPHQVQSSGVARHASSCAVCATKRRSHSCSCPAW